MQLVHFIVVARPGADYAIPEGARVHRMEGLELPESSSIIRERIAAGDNDVPVPPSVLAYIRLHDLYRSQKS